MRVVYEKGNYRVSVEGYSLLVIDGANQRCTRLGPPEQVSAELRGLVRRNGFDPEEFCCVGGDVLIRKEAEEAVRGATPEEWAVARNGLELIVLAATKASEPADILAARQAVENWQQQFPEKADVVAWLVTVLERLG